MLEDESLRDPGRFQQCSFDFLKWFTSSPGTRLSPKITLADLRFRNAGRGVLANSNIAAGQELFAVPQSLVLQTHSSEIYPMIHDSFAGLGPWDSLIVVIIYEHLRGNASSWFPYLQLLPTTFDTLVFWSPEELSELQGSAVIGKIGKKSAEENWNNTILPTIMAHEELFPIPTTNEQDRRKYFLRLAHMAGSMIMAYAFDIDKHDSSQGDDDDDDDDNTDLTEDDEENPAKGMVPFADMLNADAGRNNARLFQEDGFFIMKTIKDIRAGEDVFNDYGPLPRSDLLRMYGYITDSYACFDVVEISAGLLERVAASSGTDPSYLSEKREELESLGLVEDAFLIGRPESDSKLQDVIPVDLKMLVTAFCRPAESSDPTNLRKRAKGSGVTLTEASLLSTLLTNRLREYRTSLETDAEILEAAKQEIPFQAREGPSRHRYSMAVQVRKGEKEILHQALQLIQDFIAKETIRAALQPAKRKRSEFENEKATIK